jgi:histone H3/H4
MADDLGLPKTTLVKLIKDALPKDMKIANETTDLIVQCCNEFVHILSTVSNEISDKEKRTTINPDHIQKALEELGFNNYLDFVKEGGWVDKCNTAC